jgi:hypothetical protein
MHVFAKKGTHMEFVNKEIAMTQDSAADQLQELNDLQLAIVGGGNADVVFK